MHWSRCPPPGSPPRVLRESLPQSWRDEAAFSEPGPARDARMTCISARSPEETFVGLATSHSFLIPQTFNRELLSAGEGGDVTPGSCLVTGSRGKALSVCACTASPSNHCPHRRQAGSDGEKGKRSRWVLVNFILPQSPPPTSGMTPILLHAFL